MAQAGGTWRGSTSLPSTGPHASATAHRCPLAGIGRDRSRCGVRGTDDGRGTVQDDIRAAAAQYYDANPTIPDDRAFYMARLPSADAAVLELGCGTGRILLPLAAACGSISGWSGPRPCSRAVARSCRSPGCPQPKLGGTRRHHPLALGRRFDLIIAPIGCFNCWTPRPRSRGCFGVCGRISHRGDGHLERVSSPGRLRAGAAGVGAGARGVRVGGYVDGVRLRCDERRARLDPATHILYPELIYPAPWGTRGSKRRC